MKLRHRLWLFRIWLSRRRKVDHEWCGNQRYRGACIRIDQEVRLDKMEKRIEALEKREAASINLSMFSLKMPDIKK